MTSTRIPEALQKVFLTSNRGKEVNVAPPSNMAAKFFGRVTKSLRRPSFRGAKIATPTTSTTSKTSSESGGDGVFASPHRPIKRSTRHHVSVGFASPRRSNRPTHTSDVLDTPQSCDKTSLNRQKSDGSQSKRSKAILSTLLSPQDYLDALMKNRGYDIVRHHTLDTGFFKTNTELQIASYQPHVIGLAFTNPNGLRAVLNAGVSPNPCNKHGESMLHSICRKRNLAALEVLIERGSDLHVCDDYGRTPLHDACWNNEPNFDVIDCLLNQDKDGPLYLFHLLDRHGCSPLSYVDKVTWHDWLCYLEARKDEFWPLIKFPPEPTKLSTTLVAKPKTLTVSQPFTVLPPKIAMDVASGRLAPSEAMLFVELSEDSSDSSWSDSSSDTSSEGDFSMKDEKYGQNNDMQSSAASCDFRGLVGSQCSTTYTDSGEDEASILRRQSSWGVLNLMSSQPICERSLQTSWGEATLGA